jgi:LPXTG-motif cell wall-anchored protein
MMLRRMVVIATAAAAALVVGASSAGAQQYPPANNFVNVDDVSPHPCQVVTITAGTYDAGSSVDFAMTSASVHLGTATADESGVATLSAEIPDGTEAGEQTVTVSGTSDGRPLSQSITLDVSGTCAGEAATPTTVGAGASDLPKTGDDSTMPLARAAALLLAVGGVLLLATRRRRAEARAH